MANYALRRSLLKLSFENLSMRVRSYHPEITKFPTVPLHIHDSDYQLFPESGQPYNLFVPDLSQLNYDDFKNDIVIRFNDTLMQGQRIIKWTSESNLILISNQAIQTARVIPNKILKKNYFVSGEGIITFEKILQLEKLMTSAKEKLTETCDKLPDPKKLSSRVLKAWENVKQKLPSWQKSIANKLEQFQNRLNRKAAKKEEEDC